jgi:hypothetical protein
LKEIGEREGKFYAINVPLKDGIDDSSFTRLFKTVSFYVLLAELQLQYGIHYCYFWLDGLFSEPFEILAI